VGQRAAIYCRVSTADQSCERQEGEPRAFAERAGYEVAGVFRETAALIGSVPFPVCPLSV